MRDAALALGREQLGGLEHDNVALFVILGRPSLQQVAWSLTLILGNFVDKFVVTVQTSVDAIYFCSTGNGLKYRR